MSRFLLKDLISLNLKSKENIIENSFPKEVGSDYMEKIYIQDRLIFLKTNCILNKPIYLEAKKQDKKKLVITICLKGSSSFVNKDDKQTIYFKEGFTTICFFENTCGFREFKDKNINQIRLILSEDFLLQNFKKSLVERYFYNNKNLQLLSFSKTSIKAQILIDEIINCKFCGELSRFYIKGKILELLALELAKLEKNEDDIFLNDYDKKAIIKAKEILFQEFKNPPTIKSLAKMVHLNEAKFKKAFKQIYKTSPYKLLLSYRMNIAKNLLLTNDYNINEVALKVGYKFANNFTNAFYKEFKLLPKDILKNQ